MWWTFCTEALKIVGSMIFTKMSVATVKELSRLIFPTPEALNPAPSPTPDPISVKLIDPVVLRVLLELKDPVQATASVTILGVTGAVATTILIFLKYQIVRRQLMHHID